MPDLPISILESLPLLVQELICQYLDDDSNDRHNLWAFSLASRSCSFAASPQRFCQIRLNTCAENIETDLRQLTSLLSIDNRFHHVRRLKVTWHNPAEEQEKVNAFEQAERKYHFDMHSFCRPPNDWGGGTWKNLAPEAWQIITQLIKRLSGLQDLVWAYSYHMPQSLLSVLCTANCRLHMYEFRLPSLVQKRGNPKPIDAVDYALLTSPSLYSLGVIAERHDGYGNPNYIPEVIDCMVAGIAPNLAHIWFMHSQGGSSLDQDNAIRLGRPTWSGFFPSKKQRSHQVSRRGNLQSMAFISHESLSLWASLTDFTKLRYLNMHWNLESGLSLADMARLGGLRSIHTLNIFEIDDESEQSQDALNQVLESLDSLQHLSLEGYVSPKTFDIILHYHGQRVRSLSIDPYRDEESQNTFVWFPTDVVQRVADQCVNLEKLSIPIDRTHGDNQEVGIYRALSRLPKLTDVLLRLCFLVEPEDESWVDERVENWGSPDATEIPFASLRDGFSNGAIDSTLARSIFDIISPDGSSLRYLRIYPRMKSIRHFYASTFYSVMRWFNRPWVCERNERGAVTVRELDVKATVSAGEKWEYLSEGEMLNWGDEVYQKVFDDIWPHKTEKWWNDWESLPLSVSET